MRRHFGAFTLAEVLITLGIIGVVAAMTMPTLINQTNGAQYKAAYKKALSVLSQAVTLNVALEDTSFADVTDIEPILKARANVLPGGINGYNVSTTRSTDGASTPTTDSNTTLFFNDGSMFTFPKTVSNCTDWDHRCKGYIDVNGKKGPNKETECDSGTSKTSCTVSSPVDVYPVCFYGQTVLPNSDAGRAVLFGK